MSFAGTCKEELTRIRLHGSDVRLSQLIGLTLTAGGIRLFQKPSVFYQTESPAVARHIAALAASDYELDSIIERKERETRVRPIYSVHLAGKDTERYLKETGALTYGEDGLHMLTDAPDVIETSDETVRAFLRGSFLGGGTCVDPKRGYRLEIVCRVESVAKTILSLLERCGLYDARITPRKERVIVYMKDGEGIAGFLALIGASSAVLSVESVRAEKDMRNYINRKSNCETANLDKQVVASLRQRAAIKTIRAHMNLKELPPSLCEAAELRLNYPDATLGELAELAGIQKSGMNHRLARLLKLAEELEGIG